MDWDFHTIQLGAQQGWVCPLCGRANAPWVAQCSCTNAKTFKIDYTKEMTTTAVPTACRTCSNHPSNGGSGICNCTLDTLGITF